MALAHRAAPRLTLSELMAEASDFCRDAWRDCWLPMVLLVGAHTYLFVRGHVATADWHKSPLDFLVPLLLLLYVPLYGGLYRSALGGKPLRGLGLGGLQWKGVEWRLIAVGLVIVFLAGLAMIPFMLVNLIAAVVMGLHVQMSLGPFGGWARWTPAAIIIWLAFFALMAPRIARLMLGWAYSSAEEKIEPFAGWGPGKPSGWSIAIALVLASAPMLLGWLAVYALTMVEPDALGGEYWPVPESLGVGLLLGVLKVAVVAPLSVGVLTGAWWLLEGDAEAAAPVSPAGAPASHDPPRHDHRRFMDSLGPAALAAAAAAAATIALREAAELGLHHTQVDRNSAPPEPDGAAPAAEASVSGAPGLEEHAAETFVGDAQDASPPADAVHEEIKRHEEIKGEVAEHALAPLAVAPDVVEIAAPVIAPEPIAPEPIAAETAAPTAAVVATPEPEAPTAPSLAHAVGAPAPVEAVEVSAPAAVKPFTVAPARPDATHFAALSDWPHTVLPPWTALVKDTVGDATPTTLASEPEPDHR